MEKAVYNKRLLAKRKQEDHIKNYERGCAYGTHGREDSQENPKGRYHLEDLGIMGG